MKIEINGHTIETQDYVDKWVKWALDETPATDDEVIKNVQWIYEYSGLKRPKVKVFRDYDVFIRYFNKHAKKVSSVRDSASASVGYSVRDSVRSSVMDFVMDSVRSSVWSSVGYSVRSSVSASVSASVWSSAGSSVSASVSASVWSPVRSSVGYSVWSSVGAWHWADDMAFADIFADTKVLDEEKIKELKKLKKALSTQRLAIHIDDACFVLVAPKVTKNKEGQLHNEKEPAINWSGSGIYYLKGIEFPKDWHTKIVEDKLTPEEILAIDNIEHRRIAWEYMNKKKLEGLDGFHVLDEIKDDGKGYPMRIIQFNHPDAGEIRYYNCFCPTTGREYYIGTEEKTCKKAKNKSFGLGNINYINEW